MEKQTELKILKNPSHFIFFTGKGGVGKTSLSAAIAIKLADLGKKILLVSTDSASNLDEMLSVELKNYPTSVPNFKQFYVLNINPNQAAESYRSRVIEQMRLTSTKEELSQVEEQLSGACTTEIAAFDEFAHILSIESSNYDHIIFDTAPTGHTLRLLSLPKAWTGFLNKNNHGASCLGPHSGLKMQESRFRAALEALCDPMQTSIVLVTRPDQSAIKEAARTSEELKILGFNNQHLMINGVFHCSAPNDQIALSFEKVSHEALSKMPKTLLSLTRDEVPLRSYDTVGLNSLRELLDSNQNNQVKNNINAYIENEKNISGLEKLADELAKADSGLIMIMGKGGVGKTTIATAIAIGLAQRGKSVYLSTTDPAAHVADTLMGALPGLKVDKIDPKVETQKYIDKVMTHQGQTLDEASKALILEDLQSPCTEEVAVFHAFSKIVSEAGSSFVVLDTAPTGHSLLLMDATGAYHRQAIRQFKEAGHHHIITPLMRLQDSNYTKIIIVTLAEATPVSQAVELQEDLRRAKIEPYAWILNKSILGTKTKDSLLSSKIQSEKKQLDRITSGLAKKLYSVPWQSEPPVGIENLSKLVKNKDPLNVGL